MRSGNRIPEMRATILAALAKKSVVRVECHRPDRLVKVLRKELQMCDLKIESRVPSKFRGMMKQPAMGVIVVTWKEV